MLQSRGRESRTQLVAGSRNLHPKAVQSLKQLMAKHRNQTAAHSKTPLPHLVMLHPRLRAEQFKTGITYSNLPQESASVHEQRPTIMKKEITTKFHASIHPVNQQSHLSESGLGNRCICSTPGAATTALSGRGGQACPPSARAAQLLERRAAPGRGCQELYGASVKYLPDLFSVKIQKSSYNWLPFIQGWGGGRRYI